MYPEKQVFLILGLSRSGRAAAEYLLSRGASVYLYDETESERIETLAKTLEEKGAKRVSKENLHKAVDVCDALVLSPGIPIDHPLAVSFKRNKKAVLGETELAAKALRCPVLAVTGTNGKTTTVSMLTEVLKAGSLQAYACGNIGTPMLDFAYLSENSIAVAEISSFQLETLNSLCPHVAIVLNITEDHLSRHYNMENYTFLKAKLLKNSTETEYAVLNYDDPIVRTFAEKTKAKIIWFSLRERVRGAYFENGNLYFGTEKIVSAAELLAEGAHNVQNALAVIAAAKIMGVKNQTIADALTSFKGIKHRIERIGEIGGVAYIDDSKGTNVDATIKAIECMKTETVLLLGGKNKGYEYSKLFAAMKRLPIVHAVLYGENRFELLKSARANAFDTFTLCDTFEFAVKIAVMKAKVGQTVLLSPASASFDEFASYEERGDKFVEIVRSFASEHREIVEKEEENNEEDTQDAESDGSDRDDGEENTTVDGNEGVFECTDANALSQRFSEGGEDLE